MPADTSILKWFDELSQASFAALVLLILFGNFIGIWVWGKVHREALAQQQKQHDDEIAILRAQCAKAEADAREWKDMSLGLLAPLEKTLVRRQGG